MNKNKNNKNVENDICSICLNVFSEHEYGTIFLDCCHEFGTNCYKQLLQNKLTTCPLCRVGNLSSYTTKNKLPTEKQTQMFTEINEILEEQGYETEESETENVPNQVHVPVISSQPIGRLTFRMLPNGGAIPHMTFFESRR